ncbi:hypothetical protein [Streptosporangium minutum]|nr:hypothetical protein [Streptosporangium minutum]
MAAMPEDSRARAGIDIDGTAYARIPKSGLPRPFLSMGSAGHLPGGRDNPWDRGWELLTGWKRRLVTGWKGWCLTGWKRRLVLPGADHRPFTDVPLLAGALGIGVPGDRARTSADRGNPGSR